MNQQVQNSKYRQLVAIIIYDRSDKYYFVGVEIIYKIYKLIYLNIYRDAYMNMN